MRAFTREMGLNGGYNIEVMKRFFSEIIDMMIFELDKPENNEWPDGCWLSSGQDTAKQELVYKERYSGACLQLFNENTLVFAERP